MPASLKEIDYENGNWKDAESIHIIVLAMVAFFHNFAQAPDAPSRLLDVLDMHFYSEATSSECTDGSANGYRIINSYGKGSHAERGIQAVQLGLSA